MPTRIEDLLILCVVWFSSSFALAMPNCPLNSDLAQQIQSNIAAQATSDKIPSVTYAIFNDSCMMMTGEVGSVHAQKTVFRIASVSKMFAVISATQLVESGVLDPEASILELDQVHFVQFLKKHETKNRLKQWAKIKVRHLMTHQAGISKDVPGTLLFFNTESLANNSYPTLKQFYAGLTKVEFLFEPGQVPTGLKYSNLGMNLIGRIVEDMNPEGLTYTDYVARHILKPLSMHQTYYDVPRARRDDMVQGMGSLLPDGTRTSVPKAFFAGAYEGSIGVATTATDLANLGKEFLRMTEGGSETLTDNALITDFLTLKSPATPSIAWANGPSWQILPGETTKNAIWLGHTGTGTSERSILAVAPEKNLGVVVLFNVTDANREKYVKIISDLLPQTTQPNRFAQMLITNAKSFLDKTPAPQMITPPTFEDTNELRKFVGTYFADIAGYQKVDLSSDGYLTFFGQKLVVEDAGKGIFRFPPIPGSAGTLFNREPVVFTLDKNGSPTGIRAANVKKFEKR